MMENVCICVYRDTIKEHDDIDNLAYVQVTMDFLAKYVRERQGGLFKDLEEFLNEYTADNTEDFYKYAMKHNAAIAIEHE